MLSKRYRYDGKPSIKLNDKQLKIKKQLETKLVQEIYRLEELPCCICQGKNFELLSEKDRYGLSHSVVICNDCGLIQTSPRMNQTAYNQFYELEQKKLYIGKDVPTDTYFTEQYRRGSIIYNYLSNSLDINLNGLRIFEIGCSAGGILKYFQDRGNRVCGCDLNKEYVMYGRNRYNLDLQIGTFDKVDLRWTPDIILYVHTLEHILNPINELQKLRSLYCNTYLYIEVPGVKYPRSDFMKSLQNAHVFYFTLTSLNNLLRKSGYYLIAGNEMIRSIYKPINGLQRDIKIDNDYAVTMQYLLKLERLRPLLMYPSLIEEKLKSLLTPLLIKTGLYDKALSIYQRLRH